jgi:hypothetical protein
MCSHEPILVYDSGGTQLVWSKCGRPLGDWKSNGDGKKYEQRNKREVYASLSFYLTSSHDPDSLEMFV